MTHCKETEQSKKEVNNSCARAIFYGHREKIVKTFTWILFILYIMLIIVVICMAETSQQQERIESRAIEAPVKEIISETIFGNCSFDECVVHCWNTDSLYTSLHQAMQDSVCQRNIKLNLYHQHFPDYTLQNEWLPTNKTITEVFIVNGSLSSIQNEAFNCIDFTRTRLLVFENVKIAHLSNGILLGLSRLKTLYISGEVEHIDRCFFQPVQMSLIQLSINGKLVISGSNNIFGISFLPYLSTLDLSDNIITGSLKRSFFMAIPNTAYLSLSNSKISSIDENAFDDIAKSLRLLDLSNNLLTTINHQSIEDILQIGLVKVYLLGNDWKCDCNLKPLIKLYDKYIEVFGDIPYCKYPSNVYGVLFTDMKFGPECDEVGSTTETPNAVSIATIGFDSSISDSTSLSATMPSTTKEVPNSPLRMRCLNVLSVSSEEDVSSSEEAEYFIFDPPCHEFELVLLENDSVRIKVYNSNSEINIIWFSDALEDFTYSANGITIDYNCDTYTDPYLVVADLHENTTYTFCLIPMGSEAITPFNCLPIHVPINTDDRDNIWIALDEKQFTLGMICLIFTCSMIVGGVIAYFGIRAFPELLEGSGNVLVVKKSDQTCYVSTITDGEYMSKRNSNQNNSFKQTMFPCSLETRFNSCKIQSLCGKTPKSETHVPNTYITETDDYYELPCLYDKAHECKSKCISNNYSSSPLSPPPLPKRN